MRPTDVVVDVGTGAGEALPALRATGALLVAVDIAREMITQVGRDVARLQADVRALPLADGSVDVILGLNAVPCWAEMRRVLAPGGRLLWVSSFGPDTPLYVAPDAVAAALGSADVVWARAGHGSWLLATEVPCIG